MATPFLTRCLDKIEDGLREISPDDELANRHMHRAGHNLRAAGKLIADSDAFLERSGIEPDSLTNGQGLPYDIDEDTELIFYDWATISSYYAIYHTILALLVSIGYTSKNHSCAIASLDYFFRRKGGRLGDRETLVMGRIRDRQKHGGVLFGCLGHILYQSPKNIWLSLAQALLPFSPIPDIHPHLA
jgi:hypothetical protein